MACEESYNYGEGAACNITTNMMGACNITTNMGVCNITTNMGACNITTNVQN